MRSVVQEPELAGAGGAGGTIALEPHAVDPTTIKARGYWESIWLRFRKDKVAIAGGLFVILLFLVSFIGAPIAAHLLGHGPNQPFTNALDAQSLPLGPWSHFQEPVYPGA